MTYNRPKATAKYGIGMKTNINTPKTADNINPIGIAFNLNGDSAKSPPMNPAIIRPKETIPIGRAVSPVVNPYLIIRKGAKYVINTVDPILWKVLTAVIFHIIRCLINGKYLENIRIIRLLSPKL